MTPPKTVVPGKVDKDKNNNRKFKIKKDKASEVDIEIDIEEDGNYDVTKLSTVDLDTELPNNGGSITWLNNFEIKENNSPINKAYKIKVPGLSKMINDDGKKLVIQDGNRNNSKPYLHDIPVTDDTFDFSDGDPAVGVHP